MAGPLVHQTPEIKYTVDRQRSRVRVVAAVETLWANMGGQLRTQQPQSRTTRHGKKSRRRTSDTTMIPLHTAQTHTTYINQVTVPGFHGWFLYCFRLDGFGDGLRRGRTIGRFCGSPTCCRGAVAQSTRHAIEELTPGHDDGGDCWFVFSGGCRTVVVCFDRILDLWVR